MPKISIVTKWAPQVSGLSLAWGFGGSSHPHTSVTSVHPAHGGCAAQVPRSTARTHPRVGRAPLTAPLLPVPHAAALTFSAGAGGENLLAQARKMSGSGLPFLTSGSSPRTM